MSGEKKKKDEILCSECFSKTKTCDCKFLRKGLTDFLQLKIADKRTGSKNDNAPNPHVLVSHNAGVNFCFMSKCSWHTPVSSQENGFCNYGRETLIYR